MGAPFKRSLEERYELAPPTVLIGRQIHVEDVPQMGLFPNMKDSHSDPNFQGAFDREKICYHRTITVEIVKFLGIWKKEYPEPYNETLKTVKLTKEIYEQIYLDVPYDDRTDQMREEKAEEEKKIHEEEVRKMNELEYEKKLYLVSGGRYEEREMDEKRRLKKLLKHHKDQIVRV